VHPPQVPDHRCDFLPSDPGHVRTAGQAVQSNAILLRHEAEKEASSSARSQPGLGWRLIVTRPSRIGNDEAHGPPNSRCPLAGVGPGQGLDTGSNSVEMTP
jgi:hypothetical protein